MTICIPTIIHGEGHVIPITPEIQALILAPLMVRIEALEHQMVPPDCRKDVGDAWRNCPILSDKMVNDIYRTAMGQTLREQDFKAVSTVISLAYHLGCETEWKPSDVDDVAVEATDNAYQPVCSVAIHEMKAHKDGPRAILSAIRAELAEAKALLRDRTRLVEKPCGDVWVMAKNVSINLGQRKPGIISANLAAACAADTAVDAAIVAAGSMLPNPSDQRADQGAQHGK